jgi:gamma-glutamyltranspeptidase
MFADWCRRTEGRRECGRRCHQCSILRWHCQYVLVRYYVVVIISILKHYSSGIGGGGFMTLRIPSNTSNNSAEYWTIDFRETGPVLANTTMYKDSPKLSKFGGLSVGVPGELRGFEEAHRRWGKLNWSRLVQPSVDLAAGWRVGKELGRRIHVSLTLRQQLSLAKYMKNEHCILIISWINTIR